MSKRKMLLIVPHQDDEMLVGGGVLYQFANSKEWDSYVLYTTEGAAINEDPKVRMQEAIKALKEMGISENHIIFLGYGNGWQGKVHIYHAAENDKLISLKGKTETFALPNHEEFCYQKYGVHHCFSRQNYKKDLSEAITDIKPDVIIGVDLDDHEEHMATSLLLDECLEIILKKEADYRPLLLKKFAYDGLWHGKDDYFNIPRVPTLNGEGRDNDTRNPAFQWNERLRFANPPQCNTCLFCNNRLNKAMRKHKSQGGWLCAARLINSDNVFWVKRTDNLALTGEITTSSGNSRYLNDFKMVDAVNVRNKKTEWGNCSWIPKRDDKEKKIIITWKEIQKVKQIVLYESPEKMDGMIKNIQIKLDENYEFQTGELKHGGISNQFNFDDVHLCKKIEITLLATEGVCGLSEIEVFQDKFDLDKYLLPLMIWREKKTSFVLLRKIINFVEKKIFHLKAHILLSE